MKVTVTNTALLNGGDAAIMQGTAQILRQAFGPQLAICLRDQQPEAARALYPDYPIAALFHDRLVEWRGSGRTKLSLLLLCLAALAWRTPLRASALRLLPLGLREELCDFAASDLIVSAGGTYLVPHYRLRPKLLELLVARLAGRPYVLFTQSLGPFDKDRRLLAWLLRGARAILVRDRRSAERLERLGVPETRIVLCADAAFAMPESAGRQHRPSNATRIGISVRDWPHFAGEVSAAMDRYLDGVAATVTELIEETDAEVTFISTCQGNGSYWTDDATTADAVVGRLPEALRERVKVDRSYRKPEDLRRELGRFDLFVATRMHGAILALLAEVPVVAIAYEEKTTDLFGQLGFEAYLHDIETLDSGALTRSCRNALAHTAELRREIAARTADLRASAYSATAPIQVVMESGQ